MPGSRVGYGHDAHGVNLANLRLSSSKTQVHNLGGYRAPFDWKNESDSQMDVAGTINTSSKVVRNESNIMENRCNERNAQAVNAVEAALRSKMEKTDLLKNSIENAIKSVEDELSSLNTTKAKTERLIDLKLSALSVNEKRLGVRSVRPTREMTNDEVQSRLQGQTMSLDNQVDTLRKCAKNAANNIENLERTREKLMMDLEDKATVLELDKSCLGLSREPKADFYDGTLQRRRLKYPHSWAKSTDEELMLAKAQREEAARFRNATKMTARAANAEEKMVEKMLCKALEEKLGATTNLKSDLKAQLAKVRKEEQSAEMRRQELAAALAATEEPLRLAQQRYLMRKQRPNREMVHDEVEDALASELVELQHTQRQLTSQLRTVEGELAALRGSAAQLEANLDDKFNAINLDSKCLMLDGRDTLSQAPPSVADTFAGNGTIATSAGGQAATANRIGQLEMQLAEARANRVAMEGTVRQMQASLEKGPGVM